MGPAILRIGHRKTFPAFSLHEKGRRSEGSTDPALRQDQPGDAGEVSRRQPLQPGAGNPGGRQASDSPSDNVYTRAAGHLDQWIRDGILAQDVQPGFYAYFQDFSVPDTSERATRMGFIGIGKVEDYSAGVVYRHEQTLSGPKKDRLELLRHTRAHFGQIFMLYPDRELAVDRLLDEAARAEPDAAVQDEYGGSHRLWRIAQPEQIQRIQQLMADKK